jgi:signal transduction histidine kinase
MYIVSKGLKKNDRKILEQGWEMLERNFNKTTSLVKDFLSFAKGRLPELKMVSPNSLVEEIIDLYHGVASDVGVELVADLDSNIRKIPLDAQGIHTCLTNLVSNAIDACHMSDSKTKRVTISTEEKRGALIFTVSDSGSGIDSEIKRKVFTTFFTTKGGQGTGLGLLTTSKIVKEHGGKISAHSKKGQGSSFRMTFPRKMLNSLYKKDKREITEE